MIRMPVVLALLGVLLAGCAASGNLVPEQAQLEARKFEVPAGKSSIFIYLRAEQLFASAVLSEIYLDGDLVAVVGSGNFVRMDVEPGKHTIFSKAGGLQPPIPAKTVVDAQANTNHFLAIRMVIGWITNSIEHKIVSEDRGKAALDESRMVETLQ